MQSPDDDDNQHFNEVIEHIQVLASQLTLEAMEHYYDQLVLKVQVKLGTTTQKLSYYRQKLKNLVTKEEWVIKQQAHEGLLNSLTNKLDKFSDRLEIRRAKKLEKLQNPGAKPKLPGKITSKGPITEPPRANCPIKSKRGKEKETITWR